VTRFAALLIDRILSRLFVHGEDTIRAGQMLGRAEAAREDERYEPRQ
jgi:hypothetical protein